MVGSASPAREEGDPDSVRPGESSMVVAEKTDGATGKPTGDTTRCLLPARGERGPVHIFELCRQSLPLCNLSRTQRGFESARREHGHEHESTIERNIRLYSNCVLV
jgi:hypothetical protein